MNDRVAALERPLLKRLAPATTITWHSPLAEDSYAEYRDAAFLERINLGEHADALAAFWPQGGPQWDALGTTDVGDVLLVEAKAHVSELCSDGSKAGPASRERIAAALDGVATALGASSVRASWASNFYQLANRLAHLHFLRERGVPAWLVLVNFRGDAEMRGPVHVETWEAAYQVAMNALGLSRRHRLAKYVIHVHPLITDLVPNCGSFTAARLS